MNDPWRIFIGYDERQPVAYNVLAHSIIARASQPVAITPLVQRTLPTKREGLTPFTWSRFLVPWLCGYKGMALFLDIDIMVRADIVELFHHGAGSGAVAVSKNPMTFEWASVILFNCDHLDNRRLTPELVEGGHKLHAISWTEAITDLPREWNHLVGYDKPNPDAKLVHFTQGIPAFPETQDCEFAAEWMQEANTAVSSKPWHVLMGNSVHAKPVFDRLASSGKISLSERL